MLCKTQRPELLSAPQEAPEIPLRKSSPGHLHGPHSLGVPPLPVVWLVFGLGYSSVLQVSLTQCLIRAKQKFIPGHSAENSGVKQQGLFS